jgi:D-inositol-3-phosphate glycosyltransferase
LLNIAMLSYHTCPLATLGGKDTGGMNVYVRDLTRRLGQMGVHVDVFTRSQDEHVPHVLHDLGYGNRVVHVPSGPEVPLPKKVLASYLPQFVDGVQRFTQERGLHYDLIHSHYWMSGMAAIDLKKEWGVPFVHMFHTLGEMKNRVAQSASEIEGDYRIDGEHQVIQQADRLIAATLAEQAQLHFLYKADLRKVVVVPPGIDTSRFYPIPPDEARAVVGVPPDAHMLLYVGRIEPLKGVDTLIKAIASLRCNGVLSQYPHYLAIIGGDPDASPEDMTVEMSRLQDLCQQLGIGDLVVFLGKRSQDSLPYYYSAAEVVIMPSHYESFGMVALEAMACGVPVVASQVGGLAFLVQDGVTGFHFPDGDAEALCERLTALVLRPELRSKVGEQAAVYARDYSWEKIAPRILDVYDSAMRSSSNLDIVPNAALNQTPL